MNLLTIVSSHPCECVVTKSCIRSFWLCYISYFIVVLMSFRQIVHFFCSFVCLFLYPPQRLAAAHEEAKRCNFEVFPDSSDCSPTIQNG